MIIKKGTIAKISGKDTVRVKVETYKVHEKYHKRYLVTTYFLAHDTSNSLKIGDPVSIQQTPPCSRKKTWKVIPHKK